MQIEIKEFRCLHINHLLYITTHETLDIYLCFPDQLLYTYATWFKQRQQETRSESLNFSSSDSAILYLR